MPLNKETKPNLGKVYDTLWSYSNWCILVVWRAVPLVDHSVAKI